MENLKQIAENQQLFDERVQEFAHEWEKSYLELGTPVYAQARDKVAGTLDYVMITDWFREICALLPDKTMIQVIRAWRKGKSFATDSDFNLRILKGWLLGYLEKEQPEPIPKVVPTDPADDLARFLPRLRDALADMANQRHWFLSPGLNQVWGEMEKSIPKARLAEIFAEVEKDTCDRIGVRTGYVRKDGEPLTEYWSRVMKRNSPVGLPSAKEEYRIRLTKEYLEHVPKPYEL